MAFHQGEIYRCSNPSCGCEIQVTQGPLQAQSAGNQPPRCCCGMEMELSS